MNTKNDGGPAFPESGERGKASGGEGMTLRDYFAAKAMQGMVANPENVSRAGASLAYRMADAMLAAREPQQ